MRSLVLSGFMGTGKSTLGPMVARQCGVAFVDTDDILAQEAGSSVPELWRRIGEPAFRLREQGVVARLLSDPSARVIAFGGGTVTHRATRHLALEHATVVTLTAGPATILARVGDAAHRPNLNVLAAGQEATDAHRIERITQLLEERRDCYAEAHGTVATDWMAPEAAAEAVLAIADRDLLAMPLGRHSYVVELAPEGAAASRIADLLERARPSHLVVVTDTNVEAACGHVLAAARACAQSRGIGSSLVALPPGEENKTLASVSRIWDAALGGGVDRGAVVLALGGGVVGDMAGFAASTLLRGIRVVQVPTTLLAAVDASVGGKTGFDHGAGKNLLGTFHQPHGVVVDLQLLSTLAHRELRAGLAEVVKIAVVADRSLFEQLEAEVTSLQAGQAAMFGSLRAIVRRAIAAKIRIVRDDEREAGARALLNLGHTLGHALEACGGYTRYLHGEAIAIGALAELIVGVALGITPPDLVPRVRALLEGLGLPVAPRPGDLAAAGSFVGADKKRDGAVLRLPVVRAMGEATVERVPLTTFRDAIGIGPAGP
jgi:shikimate kinase/3-dehydroquinate synthase